MDVEEFEEFMERNRGCGDVMLYEVEEKEKESGNEGYGKIRIGVKGRA